jgi:hypothetical protein
MAKKTEVDFSRLLKRMRRYEEVTGKEISGSLRRGARLLGVNLAYSVPPYGSDKKAQKKGETAVQNDIIRVYTPSKPISLKHPSRALSFKEQIEKYITKSPRLKLAVLSAIKASDPAKLKSILGHFPTFSNLLFDRSVDPSIHKRTRNDYGRVRKKWKSRIVVMDSKEVKSYITARQDLVGLTKAAWAACAQDVNADVKDALRGIPAWVKRHVSRVPHAVTDKSEGLLPHITLTSKIPWADKALRPADHKEAIRISREKFFKSMGYEIKAALKKAEGQPF